MSRSNLENELSTARRSLHLLRMQLARYGISADPHVIIGIEDTERRVAQLEQTLGLPATEPRVLPEVPVPRVRHTQPIPDAIFQEQIMSEQRYQQQQDIEHRLNLLGIHRRSLGFLRAQAEQLGPHTPSHVLMQIADRTGEIARIKATLRGFGVDVDDLPGDE